MINLFFHSEVSGFVKLNNCFIGETRNILKVGIEGLECCLLEFLPQPPDALLPFSAEISFSTTPYIDSEFVEIVKFDYKNYLILLKSRPLVIPRTPKTSFFENFTLNDKKIAVNLLDSYDQTLLVSNGEKFLTHLPKHKIISPCLTKNEALNLFAIYGKSICILDSDLNVLFEGKSCVLSNDFKTLTVKTEFCDIMKHLIIQTYSFSQNAYVPVKTEYINDVPNKREAPNKIKIFLFLESLIAGFKNECMEYLSKDLADSTDFEKIQDFILPFKNFYECLGEDDSIYISYPHEKNMFFVHKLKFDFNDGEITDINFV